MDKTWAEMYEAAKAVWNARKISEYVTCGGNNDWCSGS